MVSRVERRHRPPLSILGPRTLRPAKVVAAVVLAAYAVISLYPFAWMVSGAFKNARDVLASGSIIPAHPTLQTLRQTLEQLPFATYFANSVKVTGLSLLLILIVYPLAGYAFSTLRFPLRRPLYGIFLLVLFVPSITTLLPLVLLENRLGILGTHLGLVLAFTNGAGPIAVMLLKNYYDTIPTELRESAIIDGCGELRIHFRIYLPLARPALATVGVLNFVAIWNEYILTSVSLNRPSTFTLPLGLQQLLSANVVQWNQVMAGALLLTAPVIVVFLALQRLFIAGVQGAVKG